MFIGGQRSPARRWRAIVSILLVSSCGDARTYDAELDLWPAQEEIRIGSVDDPETQLVLVTGMAVAEDGRFYVGQGPSGTIRAYYPSGELFAILGGLGSGPGEYSFVSSVGIIGDTLYAINRSPGYVNYYTLEGVHIGGEARSFDGGGAFSTAAPHIILPAGKAIVSTTPLVGRKSGERPSLLIDEHDAILDTIFV